MGLITPEADAFLQLVARAIGPYLRELVVGGGFANALYRCHPLASPIAVPHPGTTDLDITCRTIAGVLDGMSLLERLRAAGIETHRVGAHRPPVMKFTHPQTGEAVELEFLCPAVGKVTSAQAVEVERSGLTAQPLRYLNLLLIEPWELDWERVPGFSGLADLPPVRLPHPMSYVVQKVLIRRERGKKRANDCYYIYESAALFRDSIPALAAFLETIHKEVPAPWVTRFAKEFTHLFRDSSAEGPTSAARIARDARAGRADLSIVTEEMVHRAVLKLVDAVAEQLEKRAT